MRDLFHQHPLPVVSGVTVDFAVACDYAVIDQHGKLSVLGIFQHIWVARFPVVHPRLHLVLRIKGKRTEIGAHNMQIKLRDAADHEVLSGDGAVNLAEPPAGVLEIEASAILVFDVPFPAPGSYRFEIAIDDELKTMIPLTVAQTRASRSQTLPGSSG